MSFKNILLLITICAVSLSCHTRDDLPVPDNYFIIYPNGTEAFIKGNTHTLRWNAPSSSFVTIELQNKSAYYYTIAEEVINNGEYEWDIPDHIPEDAEYQIKIVDPAHPDYFATSKRNFRILKPVIKSSFTDTRDGQTYRTVKIGDQWWMAENFNFRTEEGSFGYKEEDGNCTKYGRLYSFECALQHFPPGWHLPTDEEWFELERYLGIPVEELGLFSRRGQFAGTLLKTEGDAGFNAMYGGYYNSYHNSIGHQGWEAHFWTSTATGDGKPVIRVIDSNCGGISRVATNAHGGCSVRYVKD